MAGHPRAYQHMNVQRSEDAVDGCSNPHPTQGRFTSDTSSTQYHSSYVQRQGQTNLDGYSVSSSSTPRNPSFGSSQQAQRHLQDALPYRQTASRSSVIPNSSTLVTGADSAYSQAASDSYVSSSTSGGLTPNSSASSQIPFGYSNSSSSGHPGSLAQKQRYWLHIRQQPRACRACSNSRDRRVIDPPPVVQLQISDFDPHSQHDMEDMMNQSFIVQCLLISANAPWTDMSLAPRQDDSDGTATTEKQIYGNLSASPLFCEEDPDPATAPRHPSTQLSHSTQISPANAQRTNLPATFFYYPDISIRRPGAYRLEFKLVKVNLNQRQCPVLHSVRSEPFNVVNAKDFDHVQPSTPLVRGLIARGAGFPLKLKQGSRASRTSFDE